MTITETQQTGRRLVLTAAVLGVLIAVAALFLPAHPPAAAQGSGDTPGAPVGLAVAPGNAMLVAGWNPPAGDADITSYTVQYKYSIAADRPADLSDPASGWVTASDSVTGTDAEISGLTNNVAYDVRLRASNSAGDGQWSATASATPLEDIIWAAILTASFDSGSNYFGCGINDDYRCSTALTENEFQFEDKTWRWHYFKDGVSEERAKGSQLILNPYFSTRLYSTTSDYSSRSVPADSGLRKAYLQVGNTGAVFNLGDPDSVHWHPDGLGFSLLDESANGGFGWAEGQRFPLSLRIGNSGDTDDKTNTNPTGTTGDMGNPVPGAPVGLVLALGNTKLVAGWNPPEDDGGADVTAYEVQYKTTSAPDQAGVFDDPRNGWLDAGYGGTGIDTEITGLTNGVEYDVRVRASNSAGDGQWSATASATPHEDVIWSAILTVDNDYGDGTGDFGCVIDVLNSSIDDCSVALTEDEFAFGLDTYGWTQFNRSVLPDETPRYTTVGLSALTPEDSNLRKGRMQVGSELVSLDDTVRVQWFVPDPDTYRNMQWIYSGFLLHDDPSKGDNFWTEGQRVPLSLQAQLPQVQVVGEAPPGLSGGSPDATLSALTVSDGTNDVPLTPNFDTDTAGYTASVDNSVGSVTVTATANDSNATVTVGGAAVASGSPSSAISLTAGVAEVIDIVVTAQDGTTKTYTVTVTRAIALPVMSSDATLSALTVSDGTNDVPLTPAFAADTAGYTANVDNSVDSVTVTPTVNDSNATVTVEGDTVTSGSPSSAISLTAGVAEVIDIVVTAQDGTAMTYTVTVTREMSSDATLSALTVSDGTNDVPLTPTFDSNTTGYTASVDNSVGSVTVTPTVNDPNATVTVGGDAVTSGSPSSAISLTPEVAEVIDIVVTAQDGTTKTYTVSVTRAFSEALALPVVSTVSSDATLSALTVSDGTNDVPLTPDFAADTAGYTASVDNPVDSVTVTPTANDPSTTVTVGGDAVASGSPSSAIALTPGVAEAIDVVVTTQNGTTKTYTITVTRANDTSPSAQVQGSDDGGLPESCRRYIGVREAGLRVCMTPYEGGEAVLMLTLPAPAPANGTTVTLAAGGQTATSDDYTMPSFITIGEGETSGIITIAITADGEDEGDESINIYACTTPGCDPLNPVDGEKTYNHGIVIPGTRSGGL